MKKLTALIISFVFILTMVFALPVMADDTTVTPIELQATSANGSTSGSFGTNYASMSSGNSMTFKVTLAEAGQYELVARQITWAKDVVYKVYVNEKYMGLVDTGNTKGAQETTNAEVGTFDLCAGYNEIRLQVIGTNGAWLYKLTLTRVGDMSGNFISINYANKDNTLAHYAGQLGTAYPITTKDMGYNFRITNLPSAGIYNIYLSTRSTTGGDKIYVAHDTTATSFGSKKLFTDVVLPANGEYNSMDTVLIGKVFLTAGFNQLGFHLSQAGASWKPFALHLEKVGIPEGTRSNTWGGYGDISVTDPEDAKSQPYIDFTNLEPGTYEVIGSAASWNSSNSATSGETMTAHIFTDENGVYPTQEFSFVEKGFTTFVHNIKMGEVTVTGDSKRIYFIIRNGNSKDLRIANVNLVKKDPVTKIYLGEEAIASKECSTLTMGHATLGTNRKGKITVQTTLADESQNAVMIAVLYENGKMADALPITEKVGNTLTGVLDASGVLDINTCYVKVFVWDSLDTITPLTKVFVR